MVEVRVGGHAFEEKRDERGVVGLGQLGKGACEGGGVISQVHGHSHAGDDDFHGRILGADAVDDRLEIGAHGGDRQPAQAVVAAEFEDKDVHGRTENPVDAAESARRGLATQAGVDHAPRQAGGGDFLLHDGGECLGGGVIQSVAGSEAVAEEEHGFGSGPGGLGRGGGGEQKHEKEERQGLHRLLIWGRGLSFAVPQMSVQSMLKVERLARTYPTATGPLPVLHEVSFEISAGESLAIVGPSGSGKTTLLGLCAGLDRPTSGDVVLAGESIGRLDEDGRARVRNAHVGFVFQNFQLIPTLTALENVLVPLELRGEGGREAEALALLERVGLGARAGHYPIQLSGGEQQRVALARAFINRPKILFCDEPTGNLDGTTAQAMVELIFELNREQGTTLVLVTHDQELAGKCGRIIRLRNGAVVV